MTDSQTIEGSEVPGWPFVFVVGSFDTRITFYSQQVRAFNLAGAIAGAGRLNARWRVAVVGAGAAGLSLSAALALLFPEATIHLYEREQEALHLQRGSRRRNLHPHIYDWPQSAAANPTADLPLLNWPAGAAHDVAQVVWRQFETIRAHCPRLVLLTLRAVTAIARQARDYRVSHEGPGHAQPQSDDYHAVFLTVGFGFERPLAGLPLHSYWSDAGVPDEPKAGNDQTKILVTGAGDGGLIDLAAAAVRDFDHGALIQLLTTFPGIDAITDELVRIDRAAASEGSAYDYLAAYDVKIGPWAEESGLVRQVVPLLRERISIIYNTKGPRPLSQPTATLNRFAAYLVMRASERAGHPVDHRPGQLTRRLADSIRHFRIDDTELEADVVIVRHGATRDEILSPFQEIRDAYKAAHTQWIRADPERAAPPILGDDTRYRLEAASARAELPVPRADLVALVAQAPERVSVAASGDPAVLLWGGAISPADLAQWWSRNQKPLIVQLASPPEVLGALAVTLARLVIHDGHIRLESNCPEWAAWFITLTERSLHTRALPPPWTGPVNAPVPANVPHGIAAAALGLDHALDRWMLEAIDQHLGSYLRDGSEPAHRITWRVEPDLRTRMLSRWQRWHGVMAGSPDLLNRTLRMAACTVEDDTGDPRDRAVLVGPRRLTGLLRAMTQALAAGEALQEIGPRAGAPGNFEQRCENRLEIATILASAADLIGGREIAVCAGSHTWTTDYVLLSELAAPVELQRQANASMTAGMEGQARLDAASPPPGVILGADRGFLAALETGANAMVDHIREAEGAVQHSWHDQLDHGDVQ